jgi:glycosyltransferase involved in cell wall biosynthesis
MGNTTAQKPGWLFVVPWSLREVGGVNQVVKSLVLRFREGTEFVPHLLVTTRDTKAAQVGPEAIAPLYLEVWSPVDERHQVKALFSFVGRFPGRYKALRRMVVRQNVRIINPHFPGLNAILFLALKRFGQFDGQIILSFHGSDVKAVMGTVGLERWLWKIVLRRADQIAVVSKSLGSELLALEPRIADKLTTIYNGVDLEMFSAPRVDRGVALQKSDQIETIIGIGSFSEIKGHDVLVQAFSLVVEKIPNVRLLLVGSDGPALTKIRHLVDIKHLADRVVIHTDISHEQIPSLLAGSQLFVLASRREGFPLVLVEAAAARVPIVCTNVGGMPELISDGVTGRLVDVENPNALADAIIDVLSHPAKAQQFAANCFEYVKKNLTWRQTYNKYLRLSRQT